jgi:hypothetical protein
LPSLQRSRLSLQESAGAAVVAGFTAAFPLQEFAFASRSPLVGENPAEMPEYRRW